MKISNTELTFSNKKVYTLIGLLCVLLLVLIYFFNKSQKGSVSLINEQVYYHQVSSKDTILSTHLINVFGSEIFEVIDPYEKILQYRSINDTIQKVHIFKTDTKLSFQNVLRSKYPSLKKSTHDNIEVYSIKNSHLSFDFFKINNNCFLTAYGEASFLIKDLQNNTISTYLSEIIKGVSSESIIVKIPDYLQVASQYCKTLESNIFGKTSGWVDLKKSSTIANTYIGKFTGDNSNFFKKLSKTQKLKPLLNAVPASTIQTTSYAIADLDIIRNLDHNFPTINSWASGQIAVTQLFNNLSNDYASFVMVRSNNIENATIFLDSLTQLYGGHEVVQSNMVYHFLTSKDWMHWAFDDDRFPTFSDPYIFLVDDFVIFAKNKADMLLYLSKINESLIDNIEDIAQYEAPIFQFSSQSCNPINSQNSKFSSNILMVNPHTSNITFTNLQKTSSNSSSETAIYNYQWVSDKLSFIHTDDNTVSIVKNKVTTAVRIDQNPYSQLYAMDSLLVFNTSNQLHVLNHRAQYLPTFPKTFNQLTANILPFNEFIAVAYDKKLSLIHKDGTQKNIPVLNEGYIQDMINIKDSLLFIRTSKNEFQYLDTNYRLSKKRTLLESLEILGWGVDLHPKAERICFLDNTGKLHIHKITGESFGIVTDVVHPEQAIFFYEDILDDSRKDYLIADGSQLSVYAYNGIVFEKKIQIPCHTIPKNIKLHTLDNKRYLTFETVQKNITLYEIKNNLFELKGEFPGESVVNIFKDNQLKKLRILRNGLIFEIVI